MKRLVVIILVVVTSICLSTIAYARYAYISDLSAGLTISGGTAKCTGDVSPSSSGYNSSISVVLKRKVSGVWGTYAGPWTDTGTGIGGASVSKSTSVESGYQYKVVATGKILSGGTTLESDLVESPTKTY